MIAISIQSLVASGHVGQQRRRPSHADARHPPDRRAHDLAEQPSGCPIIRGRVLDAQLVADFLLGIEQFVGRISGRNPPTDMRHNTPRYCALPAQPGCAGAYFNRSSGHEQIEQMPIVGHDFGRDAGVGQ
jgi:hypothetical protein